MQISNKDTLKPRSPQQDHTLFLESNLMSLRDLSFVVVDLLTSLF